MKKFKEEQPIIYKNELNKYRDGFCYMLPIGRNSEVYQKIDNSNISTIFDYYDFIGIEQIILVKTLIKNKWFM